ncbi:uncharacterized protein PAC_17394 [Phialocephala subalpina]|uniref:Uncharacterized protein n=1 Tax=Phialocephala subalpina TaxID=576137 RepID=A0A1L7XR63_9HELO|nr:uncharacterized protein PAC_17394 [Phialocephala subalpina]
MSAYNRPTTSSPPMASSSAYQPPTYLFLLAAQNISLYGESLTRSSPSPPTTYRAEILKRLQGMKVSSSWQDYSQGQLTLEQAAKLRKGGKGTGERGMGKKKDNRGGMERKGIEASVVAPELTEDEEGMWIEFEMWKAAQK